MNSYQDAKKRIPTNKERLLNFLLAHKEIGATNKEIVRNVGGQWSARKSELIAEGYKIRHVNEGNGTYRYFLTEIPDKKTRREKPLKVLLDDIENDFGVVTAEDLESILFVRGYFVSRKANYPR